MQTAGLVVDPHRRRSPPRSHDPPRWRATGPGVKGHDMSSKQLLLALVDDLESAWERVRTKGVVAATAEDYAAVEQATRLLRRAFLEHQERHGLPAPMLIRWLDWLAEGVEWGKTKEPVEPVTKNPMLIEGSKVAAAPPVEIALRSTHVPDEMLDHFQTLRRPSDLPTHNAKGRWGGLKWKSFASMRDEIEDLPEPADELLTVDDATNPCSV